MARIRKPHVFVDGVELKHCPKCEELKELGEFCKDKSRRDGLYPHCRACYKARHDPAVYVPQNKAWREANQEHTRVYKREYLAKRRAEDHLFKIKELLRSRLRNALQGKKKTESAVDLVGCSLEDLKKHLASTF